MWVWVIYVSESVESEEGEPGTEFSEGVGENLKDEWAQKQGPQCQSSDYVQVPEVQWNKFVVWLNM